MRVILGWKDFLLIYNIKYKYAIVYDLYIILLVSICNCKYYNISDRLLNRWNIFCLRLLKPKSRDINK